MTLIKRIFLVALAVFAVIGLSACGDATDNKADESSVSSNAPAAEESKKPETESVESKEESVISTPDVSVEEAPALIDYTVKVVDAEGKPVADASVQLCNDSTCFLPAKTNAEGVVVFQKEEGDYKACIAGTDDYTYFEGTTEITIEYTPANAE